jgi:hypothetical protein
MRTRAIRTVMVAVGLAIAVESAPVVADDICTGDSNGDGQVTVDELVEAVRNAQFGCPTPNPGPAVYQVVDPMLIPAGGVVRRSILCNPGDVATGGGYFLDTTTLGDADLDVEVFANALKPRHRALVARLSLTRFMSARAGDPRTGRGLESDHTYGHNDHKW